MAITHKYNVKVVSDEIHADIVFKPYKHISMLDVDSKYNDDIILLGAPTKTFNLAGLKISYAIIPNLEMRTEFAKRAKASGLSSINIFGFTACEAAYNYGDTWLNECLDYVYDNFIWLDNFLKENLPLCKFKIPHATYLAWVDFSKYNVPEDFQQVLLHNAKVELQDGRGFKNSDGYQRINCACPRSTLEEGMKRIAKYLNK